MVWLVFGFNAGSSLAVDANIGLIALNTHLAAISAVVGYLLITNFWQTCAPH